ncbi:hypothetical protein CONLIGDRAFT_676968 [Coniochaeta ligniaria NRRL 30616]|uniref:Uncharacterized protein n=1 Tax=Coniochaeta ligniaria NRRL 30616 TaxID=1408157 RepID=A0A1J7JUV2_9PEZI|nr:hypothetical protein CONLIGDRAFT_676968 [Coniochaeta ligniaria NRRL 30616]
MAHSHRMSVCTIDSFHKTGIVSASEPLGDSKHAHQQDSIQQQLEKDCKAADGASCCEKGDPRCSEKELGEGDDPGTPDDRDTQDSTTYYTLTEDGGKARGEKPKKVSTRRRRWALYYVLRYHVPSLVITLFLMVLYCRNWLWTAPGPSPEMRNALQFAAKIHETLIIMSLTNIVLHRLRFLLLQGQGVPLGLLSSPFQLASPLYFMTGQFWGAARSSLTGLTGVFTILLVVVSMVLAMAIGPFSAIVMLPNYGFWSVSANYPGMSTILDPNNNTITMTDDNGGLTQNTTMTGRISEFVIGISLEELYPMTLGPELGITWECPMQPIPSKTAYGCLNMFTMYFSDIIKVTPDIVSNAQMDSLSLIQNGSDPFPYYNDFIYTMARGNISQGDLLCDGTVWMAWGDTRTFDDDDLQANTAFGMATTPSFLAEQVLAAEWAAIEDMNIDSLRKLIQKIEFSTSFGTPVPVKQPAVMTQCSYVSGYTPDNFTAGAQFHFVPAMFPRFTLTADEGLVALVKQCADTGKDGCLTFVDVQHLVPWPISTGVLAVTALYDHEGNLWPTVVIQACLTSARWAEAENWGMGAYSDKGGHRIWGELRQDPVAMVNGTEHVAAGAIVRVDAGWMNGLDTSPSNAYSTSAEMDSPAALSNYDYLAATAGGVPAIVSLMVASALAAAQCAFTPCSVQESQTHFDPSVYNFTRLRDAAAGGDAVTVKTSYFVFTYGYGINNSWLTAVGIAVLLLHALLVLCHVGLILGWGFWTSDAWGSLGEMVALALRSAPPGELVNATAGVARMETWRLVAVVRERVAAGRLELVLSERGGGDGDVEMGTAGRREDGAQGGDLAVPRSDKKYG